jgi:type I restriction enzyme S subunit
MSDLPDGWEATQLGVLMKCIGGGGTPSKANPAYFQGDIPFMTVKDLHARFVADTQDHISDAALEDSASTLVPADTLIVATRMSLGKITRPLVPTAINQDLKALFLHDGIDKTYVEYLWRANESRIQGMGTGTTVKGIRLEDIRGLDVPLAPSAEQTRIANQLDTLLTRIQSCNDRFDAIPTLLKRFRQTVLDAATTGQLTDDWRMDKSGQVIAEEVVAARLAVAGTRPTKASAEFFANHQPVTPLKGVLPEPWLLTHIGMVGVVSNGSTPSRKEPSYWGGAIPWVSSGEVANGVIHRTREKITEEGFNNSSVRLLPKGTVLMAMIGEGKTRGQSAILDIDACINQNIAGVVPVEGILDSKYLWFWFRREYENTRTKGNGSGPKALNCERVRELEVNLPPLAEQAEIVRRVEALFTLADRIEVRANAARTHAQRLSPLVLAKAFRGELVPQDPQDEPANELLNRIVAAQSITPKKHVVKAATRRTPKVKPQDVSTSLSGDEPLEAIMKLDLVPDNYLETLVSAAECVSAKELWQKSKLGIDDFYVQLSKEIDRGLLEVDAQDETRICRSATSQRGRA